MKPFRFTLQAVLTVRQRQENDAREAYARALLARQQAMERLAAVERELSEAWRQLRHLSADGCAAADLSRAQQYCASVEQRRVQCAAVLAEAERHVNFSLQQMLAARQRREAVEALLDKQKKQHQRALAREEGKLLDEMGNRLITPALAWRKTVEATL